MTARARAHTTARVRMARVGDSASVELEGRRRGAARERQGHWSLNIAIAVPPALTLTLRLLVAPDGGLQLTE